MVVGEPSLMGGEFGDEDERLITRLENTQYDSTNLDHDNHGGFGHADSPITGGPNSWNVDRKTFRNPGINFSTINFLTLFRKRSTRYNTVQSRFREEKSSCFTVTLQLQFSFSIDLISISNNFE